MGTSSSHHPPIRTLNTAEPYAKQSPIAINNAENRRRMLDKTREKAQMMCHYVKNGESYHPHHYRHHHHHQQQQFVPGGRANESPPETEMDIKFAQQEIVSSIPDGGRYHGHNKCKEGELGQEEEEVTPRPANRRPIPAGVVFAKARSQLQLRLNQSQQPTFNSHSPPLGHSGEHRRASVFTERLAPPSSNQCSSLHQDLYDHPKQLLLQRQFEDRGSEECLPPRTTTRNKDRRMSMVEGWDGAMAKCLANQLNIGNGGSSCSDGSGGLELPKQHTRTSKPMPRSPPAAAATATQYRYSSISSTGSPVEERRRDSSGGRYANGRGGFCHGDVNELKSNSSSSSSSLPTMETLGGPTLAEQLHLNAYQVAALHQSWPRVKTTFQHVFKQLVQRNTMAKELFQKIAILDGFSTPTLRGGDHQREHIRLLVQLFDTAIAEMSVYPARRIQSRCIQIGEHHLIPCCGNPSGVDEPRGATEVSTNHHQQSHARLGESIWDDLGDCLTEVVAKTEALRGKREALRAWISLISYMVDSMKAGYTAQYKRRSSARLSHGQLA